MNILKTINNKQNILIISVIFVVTILFVGTLFPISYPTDIYNYYNLGLKEYAFKWFLPSGRLIGLVALYILDFFNVSINGYIVLMKIISFVLATTSIYLFYDLIINHTHKHMQSNHFLILLLSLIIFLNHGSYQYFYYPESGVMWLRIIVCCFSFESIHTRYFKKKKHISFLIYLPSYKLLPTNCFHLFASNNSSYIHRKRKL